MGGTCLVLNGEWWPCLARLQADGSYCVFMPCSYTGLLICAPKKKEYLKRVRPFFMDWSTSLEILKWIGRYGGDNVGVSH